MKPGSVRTLSGVVVVVPVMLILWASAAFAYSSLPPPLITPPSGPGTSGTSGVVGTGTFLAPNGTSGVGGSGSGGATATNPGNTGPGGNIVSGSGSGGATATLPGSTSTSGSPGSGGILARTGGWALAPEGLALLALAFALWRWRQRRASLAIH